MKKESKEKEEELEEIPDFDIAVKQDLSRIINDCPSLVRLGNKEYKIRNMRYYSVYRICNLAMEMKKNDSTLDDDNKVITALCTDLDAMCEIVAVVLCNHYFTPEGEYETFEDVMSRNDRYVSIMKAKVMQSTYDENQWGAIIIGAIKSIDLTGFFLLRRSVSTLTDSLLTRKRKSVETASLFTEAQSLQMPRTS